MPSPPIPGGTLTKMQAGHQAVKWRAVLGLEVQFRAFCCDIDANGIMGVTKQPVPVLEVDPNPVCLGDAITWDLRNSYAPGPAGTVIISQTTNFGDGSPESHLDNGNHTYATAETFTITSTIKARVSLPGGGTVDVTQTVEVQVEVVDCDAGLLMAMTYVALDGDGVWFRDWTVAAPVWVERNTGLLGNALYVNSIALRPGDIELPNIVHELYAATDDGLYVTVTGGRSWAKVDLPDPNNNIGDSPAPTITELMFIKVLYSREDPDLLWALAYKTGPSRMFVYMTEDGGLSWSSKGLTVA